MDKSVLSLLAGICCLTFLCAEPQITIGAGQTSFDRDFTKFKGNNAVIGCTFNPYSRLQFGLKYDSTTAIIDQRTTYACTGLLGTITLMFDTLSERTPYIGFNAGWLNTTLADQHLLINAHGSFTGESIVGYSFRLDDYTRLNLEYRNRYIEKLTDDISLQRYSTIAAGWSMILSEELFRPTPKASMSQEEGLSTKKDYLRQKIAYNTSQVKKYDILIDKYNRRIMDGGPTETLQAERNYLVEQKKELEAENQKMFDLLEK
jgi:hypothetical protein